MFHLYDEVLKLCYTVSSCNITNLIESSNSFRRCTNRKLANQNFSLKKNDGDWLSYWLPALAKSTMVVFILFYTYLVSSHQLPWNKLNQVENVWTRRWSAYTFGLTQCSVSEGNTIKHVEWILFWEFSHFDTGHFRKLHFFYWQAVKDRYLGRKWSIYYFLFS